MSKKELAVHSFIRFVNFVIDTIVWLILYLFTAYLLDKYFLRFNSYLINYIYSVSLGLTIYVAYYFGFEYYFQRTIGKLLSRTKVVSQSGDGLTPKTILKRSFFRLIPINVFYFLFSRIGLHDRLSYTLVIKIDSKKAK